MKIILIADIYQLCNLIAHFGLGKIPVVDSVIIKWYNNKQQIIKKLKANQTLEVNIENAKESYSYPKPAQIANSLFKEITQSIRY